MDASSVIWSNPLKTDIRLNNTIIQKLQFISCIIKASPLILFLGGGEIYDNSDNCAKFINAVHCVVRRDVYSSSVVYVAMIRL